MLDSSNSYLIATQIIDRIVWSLGEYIYDQHIESLKIPYSVESVLLIGEEANFQYFIS